MQALKFHESYLVWLQKVVKLKQQDQTSEVFVFKYFLSYFCRLRSLRDLGKAHLSTVNASPEHVKDSCIAGSHAFLFLNYTAFP